METIDIAIIVLGVVVLASAVTGAILYESDGDVRAFDVRWPTDTVGLEPASESVGTGDGQTEFTFTVPVRNVTTASFRTTLSVGSGHIGQDELTVNVTSPNGASAEDSTTLSSGSSSTSLEVAVDVSTIPTVSSVEARNASEAVDKLSEEHAHEDGTGDWVVAVDVNHGGTQGIADHEVAVTPTVGHYLAEVSPSTPDPRAS